MKKVIICILTVALSLSFCGVPVFAKTSEEADTHLQYRADKTFRIMQISDIQDNVLMHGATRSLLIRALQEHPVDLIVLTGDNIDSGSKTKLIAKVTIHQFMSIFEAFGIPVVMTFGNHDDENTTATKAYQLSCYEQYDCFIGCAGEDFGNGTLCTYYVPIYSSTDANEMVSNIWMIDSGTYNSENKLGGYACTTKAQIDWYKETSEALEQANGHKIPSLMFQHIVVPDIWDALEVCASGTHGSVFHDGKYYKLPEGTKGVLAEVPCPPNYDNGQFAAAKERGDVIAMFFGHDHVNTYELTYQDIQLINTPGATMNSYNSEDLGVRVITLHEEDPRHFETEVYSYFDLFDYDDDVARYLFKIETDGSSVATKVACFFKFHAALAKKIVCTL